MTGVEYRALPCFDTMCGMFGWKVPTHYWSRFYELHESAS